MPARVHLELDSGENRFTRARRFRGQDQPRLGVGGDGGKTAKAEPGCAQELYHASHRYKMPQFKESRSEFDLERRMLCWSADILVRVGVGSCPAADRNVRAPD
jgi:hypothetical protein